LGWLYGPATLLYATGGLAYGGARASTVVDVPIPQTCPSLNSFCSADSASAVLVGWTVGGGVEAAIASNWSAKVEYLYFDLGHLSYTDFSSVGFITGFAPGTYPNFQTTTDFRGHIVRVGLNYAFH
jgi:outer membrane immunogenic protein